MGWNVESFMPSGLKYALDNELLVGNARGDLDDAANNVDRGAVLPLVAGLKVEPRLETSMAVLGERAVAGLVAAEAGGVGEQVADARVLSRACRL